MRAWSTSRSVERRGGAAAEGEFESSLRGADVCQLAGAQGLGAAQLDIGLGEFAFEAGEGRRWRLRPGRR